MCIAIFGGSYAGYRRNRKSLSKKSINLNALFHTATPAFTQEYSTLYRAFEQSVITIVAASIFYIWILLVIINNRSIISVCFVFLFHKITHIIYSIYSRIANFVRYREGTNDWFSLFFNYLAWSWIIDWH